MRSGHSERTRRIREFRVGRVLDLLKDENLTSSAALDLGAGEGLLFECAFIGEVWKDRRITDRVRQLAGMGVDVEPVEHTHEVAGTHFVRAQIQVRFRGDS
jgi:hypothetical protein